VARRADERPLLEVGDGISTQVLLREPDDIWRVLVTDGDQYEPGKWKRRFRRFFGPSLNALHGDEHRRRRELMQPAFAAARIARLTPRVMDHVAAAQRAWAPGKRLEVRGEASAVSIAVAADCLLSCEVGEEEAWEAVSRLRAIEAAVPRLLPPGQRSAAGRALTAMREWVRELVEARAASGVPSGDAGGDLIDQLLSSDLPRQQIVHEILAVLHAAAVEPSDGIASAWWYLGKNPEADSRLYEEVAATPESKLREPGGIASLAYLRATIDEALRLLPPARYIDRCPAHGPTEIAGERIGPRQNLLISPLVTQRDPTLFERPDEFVPERMLTSRRGAKNGGVAKGALIPFGAGRHACIGEPLARLTMGAMLVTATRRWSLQVDPAAAAPTPRSGALEVELVPREGASAR